MSIGNILKYTGKKIWVCLVVVVVVVAIKGASDKCGILKKVSYCLKVWFWS